MKRLHVSFAVSDLDKSIAFYSSLFGAEPTVKRHDYAKWMLDDPRVNFVIEPSTSKIGLTHAGVQAESTDELNEVFERMKSAEAPYLPQGVTTCCYHKSEKSWTTDPDGLPWEAFYTHHQTEEYGTPFVAEAAAPVAAGSCGCAPQIEPVAEKKPEPALTGGGCC